MSTPLVFYYGLRSPYSWMADRLLCDCLPDAARAAIEYVPYWALRPQTLQALQARGASALYRDMSRARFMYILGDVKSTVRRLGYPLRWPVDGPDPDWELPHRACLEAASTGQADVLRRALFAARFEHGRNICDLQVVHDVMNQAGVEMQADAGSPPQDGPDDPAVLAMERAFKHGVFGMPFFVVGREKFWGADRLQFALRAAGLPWREVAEAWLGEAIA
jgi:2-hydroxychromene-2-carboxylate isomerase